MKKKSVKLLTVLLFGFVLMLFSSCHSNKVTKNIPTNWPGSTWTTDAGFLEFTIDENGRGIGELWVNQESRDVYVCVSLREYLSIYPIEVLGMETVSVRDEIERWDVDYRSKDAFTITVKKSTFLPVGDSYEFYRVDEEKDKGTEFSS